MFVYNRGVEGRNVPMPIYRQIAAELARRIERGDIVPDRRIPSEMELVAEFGVARTTARRAIAVLAAERYVVTVPHKGSYVLQREPAA
jgi:GntR family transcriptional regulator